jgi:phthiodiolone/phenolphthiodiolone dimycocerosates ketoreductase
MGCWTGHDWISGGCGGRDRGCTGIPPGVVREFLLNGTPDEVIEQVAQWRDYGVRYIVIVNLSFLQRSLRKGLASAMPFNKIIRGLKKL